MKRCPECRRDYYDDTLLYCLDDGNALLEGPGRNEPPTAKLRSVEPPSEARTKEIVQTDESLEPESLQVDPDRNTSAGNRKNQTLVFGVIAGLILVAGVGFFTYKFWGKSASPAQPMKIERLTTNGKVSDAAVSPDGKYIVYVLDDGGQRSLWTKQLASQSEAQVLAASDGIFWWVGFTPDSNYINFVRQEKSEEHPSLHQMPILGGAQKKLRSNTYGGVGYSPEGDRFAFVGSDGIIITRSDGIGEQILASPSGPERFQSGWRNPVWSSDGRTIAGVATKDGSGTNVRILEVQVSDGAIRPVTDKTWHAIGRLLWLPDKSGLLVLGAERASDSHSQQVWKVPYPNGEPQRVTNDFNNYTAMSATADGSTLSAVQNTTLSNVWIAPYAGPTQPVQIKSGGNDRDGMAGVAWTPDGRVVYSSWASGIADLWIMNADGSGKKQFTVGSGSNSRPTVTPDGRYVVFNSTRGGATNIWRTDLDGGNPKQLTEGNSDILPAVSPDSRWVIYTSRGTGPNARLSKVSIDGGVPVELTDYRISGPKVSPDGKWIACFSIYGHGSTWKVAIIPFEGGAPVKDIDIPINTVFHWSEDSRSILYPKTQVGAGNIWSVPLDGSPPKQITNFKTEEIFNFDVSADGKRFVLARGTKVSDVVLISNFK